MNALTEALPSAIPVTVITPDAISGIVDITISFPPTSTKSVSALAITPIPSNTTSPTDTISSSVTTGNHGSTDKHKGVPVGLVAGVIVVVLFILLIVIYFIRTWVVMKTQRRMGETSLTVTPLSLPYPSDVTSWSLPTSKQSRRMRENEKIRQLESVHFLPDSSQMEKEQDEREEGVAVDAARVEANSTVIAEIQRRGIVFSDARNNLIPRPVVDAEIQIADLQQQVQMIQGVLHLLTAGHDDVRHPLTSSVSEPPPEYA